jgi:uncharacterized protein
MGPVGLHLSLLQYLVGTLSGILVGLSLGLVGGGGSILAVPLLVYAVGVQNSHLAIGTSALAVAANAAINLFSHARGGTIKWRIAGVFALAGVCGAALGSGLSKAINGEQLLVYFAILMLVVGVLMLRERVWAGDPAVELDSHNAFGLLVTGALTGTVCGFFGIGGGFLIVPGLMYAARLPILQAIGSSLVAVTAFGLTTAFNYARSGWVDWVLAAFFVGGGAVGGLAGTRLALRLSTRRGALNLVLAALIFVVAAYVLYRSTTATR